MKRIGRSKVPYAHQLASMAENLAKKFDVTVFVGTRHTAASYGKFISYNVYFIPGFDEDCTKFSYKTWSEFLDKYFSLMKESVNG